MALAKKCHGSFDILTRSKGQAYYSSGMVRDLSIGDDCIKAKVRGSQAQDYKVQLDLTDPSASEIVGRCSCARYQDGFLCKHIWAVLLANDNNAEGVTCARNSVTVVHDWKSGQVGDDLSEESDITSQTSSLIKMLPPAMQSMLGMQLGSQSAKTAGGTNWRKQLAAIAGKYASERAGRSANPRSSRPIQLWYVLNVAASHAKETMLAVEFFQREQKKNGGWGKLKRLHIRNTSLANVTEAEDRRLVEALIGNEADEHADSAYSNYYSGYYSYRGFNRSWVRPAMFDWLLPQLAATQRFVWTLDSSLPMEEATPVVWDAGTPWESRIRLEADPDGKSWRVAGDLVRGTETRSLDAAVMLLTEGLVLFPDLLGKANVNRDAVWLAAIRKGSPIKIPFKDRVLLLKELCKLPQAASLQLPVEVCDRRELGEPRPRLEISSPPYHSVHRGNDLWVRLSFQYGDRQFAWTDSSSTAFDEPSNCILVRNPEQESVLAARLPQMGFRDPANYYSRQEADFTLPQKKLVEVVRALHADGWLIETQGIRLRRPGEFKLSVTTDVDWFELDATVDFDGVTASLPQLLKAVRNNDQFVQLDDGSQGILPEDWLAKYGQLAQLAETSGEKLRFNASQGLLLDALLAEQQNVQFDEGFGDYREKLQSFTGVKAATPVASFQGELRPYQKEGLGWLHFLREFRFGGCLADEMGLGKTVQVLALLEARRTRKLTAGDERRPSIVVVPKSLIFNWIEEAARFAPGLRILNFTGVERGDSHANPQDYDVLITTYGTLRRDVVKLKDFRFDYAILDEAQAIKNSGSQAAKACRLIHASHRLAMSGTPIENHLGELWSLFDFLNPGMLGRSTAFASFARSATDSEPESLQVLSRAVRPFLLRRTKEQVIAELPEKLEQTIACQMGPDERKAYDDLRDYYRVQLTKTVKAQGLAKSKIHVLEALLRLRQAACHPGLLDKNKIEDSSAKLDALLDQIQEVIDEGHKALVFSQFTSLLAIVRHHLDKQGVVYEYLDGQTRNRGERVHRFQSDESCRLFLISLKAGGHGLNLTAADYVFILDPWWNPAVEAQAIDRAHRIGQTKRVFAYRLIARDTVEDKILQLQKSKKDLADAIISANNTLIRNLTADDIELLLS